MNDFSYATIEAENPEMASLLVRYCQHTGKPTSHVSADEFATLMTVHGRETTKAILQMTQKTYAPEWIWQNAEGLNALCIWQPKEYFIFAMSTLMCPANSKSATAHGFDDDSFLNKVTAWQNIQAYDIDMVKPIAELCRRIIAKCNPVILTKVLAKCQQTNVAYITESLSNMMAFHLELEDLLKWLVANLARLEAEEKRGFSNFAAQRMIMGLSTLELEVCQEMNDFELIPDKSPAAVEVILGQTYARPAKKKEKYSCKPLSIQGNTETSVPKLSFNANAKTVLAPPIVETAKEIHKPAFKPSFKTWDK